MFARTKQGFIKTLIIFNTLVCFQALHDNSSFVKKCQQYSLNKKLLRLQYEIYMIPRFGVQFVYRRTNKEMS